jgi:protein SCO1/2
MAVDKVIQMKIMRTIAILLLFLLVAGVMSGVLSATQPLTQPMTPAETQAVAQPAVADSGFKVVGQPAGLYGKVYNPPRAAFDFTLPTSTGERAHLRDYQGRVVLIFFGYTNCPDICPTTLADIKGALAQLGDQAQDVTVLFITVDPTNDTPERLTEYLGYFHEPGFVGLSGTEAEAAAIAYQYGAKFYREENTTTTGGYSVAHTARLFLINRQGQWAMTMEYGTPVEQLAANLTYWLAR